MRSVASGGHCLEGIAGASVKADTRPRGPSRWTSRHVQSLSGCILSGEVDMLKYNALSVCIIMFIGELRAP